MIVLYRTYAGSVAKKDKSRINYSGLDETKYINQLYGIVL